MTGALKAWARVAGMAALLSAAASFAPALAANHAGRGVAGPVAGMSGAATMSEPESTSSVAPSQVDPGCSRARKRLWVEGEGWIVRKVTTCY